jgi:HEAT repeat protein
MLARDTVEDVCIEAINSIGKIADSNDINFYLSVLFTQVKSPMVLREILRSFSMSGNIDEIFAATKHPYPEVRGFAISLLRDKPGVDISNQIMHGLDDPSDYVRLEALKALGKMANRDEVRIKIKTLANDNSPLVRREVAELLVNYPHLEAKKILIKLLGDSDPYTRKSAAMALGRIGDEESARELIRSIEIENILNVKTSMVLGLAKINLPIVYNKLSDLCSSDEAGVRIIALRGLFDLHNKDAIKIAEEILQNDSDDWARGQAAGLLAKTLGSSILPLLKNVSESGGVSSKTAVAEVLGEIVTEESLNILHILIQDTHSQVRSFAYESLGKMNTEKSRGLLITGVKDKDPDVRWSVATAMGKTGNREFLEILTPLASDDISTYRGKVSDAVLNAIKLLG